MSTDLQPRHGRRPPHPCGAASAAACDARRGRGHARCDPADYLDLFDPLRSGADLRGRIVAVQPETADAATLVIKPGRGWARPRARPVRPHRRRRRRRPPVARLLADPRPAAPTAASRSPSRRIPDGVVSNHLVRRARPGTMVQLDQAAGDFVLPDPIAGQGAVRHRRQRHHPGDRDAAQPVLPRRAGRSADIVLLHSALSARRGDLRRRAAAATPPRGRLRLVERHTDVRRRCSTSPTWTTLVPDLAERTTWACGPAGLLDALEEHHDRRAALPLHTERFRLGGRRDRRGRHGHASPKTGAVVEADGATPILDAAEDAGVLMPSGCRMGICFGCVAAAARGRRARPAQRRAHHRRARRRRPHPDLRHRPPPAPATSTTDPPQRPAPTERRPTMTVIQKKPDNPIAHLTAEDIEQLGSELDAIRQDVIDRRGERDAAYIRKVIDVQRKLELGSRAVLLVSLLPAGLGRRHRRPVGRQDPREHGDRPQRPARPVGLDARPEDPLDHLGVGQRLAGRAVEALAQRAAPHLHQRDRQGQRPRLRHHARRRGPALAPVLPRPAAVELHQRAASSSTASRRTTSSSAQTMREEARPRTPSSRRRLKQVLQQDPQAGRPRTTSSTRCCPAHRLVPARPWPRTSPPTWSATCGATRSSCAGTSPRASRPSSGARSRARPAASGTCARCSARPTSPAPRPCTS